MLGNDSVGMRHLAIIVLLAVISLPKKIQLDSTHPLNALTPCDDVGLHSELGV